MQISKQLRKNWQLYVLLIIPVVYIVVFHYVPMFGAQIAFKNFSPAKGFMGSPWVGLKHFIRFFNSYQFWPVLRNTLVISFYGLIAGFPFPIILALALNYVNWNPFKKSVQTLSYAPHFISLVVLTGMLMQILDMRSGMLNNLVMFFGGQPINFLGDPAWFPHVYVWSGVWQGVGFASIIYLAVLSGISPELHEAAVVDGATRIQRIFHIDLPGLVPTAVILLILNTGNALNLGFEKAYLLQNPMNLSTSEVIDTYVYKVSLIAAFPDFSFATAIGLFKSAIGLVLILSVNQIARKFGETSLW